jgi:predicted O-methyltransferase YrrM
MKRGESAQADGVLELLARKPSHAATFDYAPPAAPRYSAESAPALARLLEPQLPRYAEVLRELCAFAEHLERIDARPTQSQPGWLNPWIPALDGIALYGYLAQQRPRRYLEIGSGNSTRFARRAIDDHGVDCEIISIDPQPRAEIDALCDLVIRKGLESADLTVFSELGANDVVFLDSSHRCFTGSDVTVFFTEVLPGLPRGVTIGVHDIFLPYDYPPEWTGRLYSEQYLLACFLLAPQAGFETLLPVYYLTRTNRANEARALCRRLPGAPEATGASFWIRKN